MFGGRRPPGRRTRTLGLEALSPVKTFAISDFFPESICFSCVRFIALLMCYLLLPWGFNVLTTCAFLSFSQTSIIHQKTGWQYNLVLSAMRHLCHLRMLMGIRAGNSKWPVSGTFV